MSKKQKYKNGDLVRIADDLGPTMRHFRSSADAIILYSYNDKFGCGDTDNYALHIKDSGFHAWYKEHQLTLIEKNRLDLLDEWEREEKEYEEKVSDLDWIFENGSDVLKGAHGSSIQALAECLGVGNLWGSHGEGIDYYFNSIKVLSIAEPFLREGDKAGWLKFCEDEG